MWQIKRLASYFNPDWRGQTFKRADQLRFRFPGGILIIRHCCFVNIIVMWAFKKICERSLDMTSWNLEHTLQALPCRCIVGGERCSVLSGPSRRSFGKSKFLSLHRSSEIVGRFRIFHLSEPCPSTVYKRRIGDCLYANPTIHEAKKDRNACSLT